MRNLRNFLTPVCLAATTLSMAQGVIAPSSIDPMSPWAQPLSGTLFFDQKQRDQMDRVRRHGGMLVDQITAESAPSVLNGFAKRSDGMVTVWVDGAYKSLDDANMAARIQSSSVGMDMNAVVASDPGSEKKLAAPAHARARAGKPVAVRKSDSGVSPPRK